MDLIGRGIKEEGRVEGWRSGVGWAYLFLPLSSENSYLSHFPKNKCGSVSSVIGRVKAEVAKDRKLRPRLEKLICQLNKSQEQT